MKPEIHAIHDLVARPAGRKVTALIALSSLLMLAAIALSLGTANAQPPAETEFPPIKMTPLPPPDVLVSCPDSYEPDNSPAEASSIALDGTSQTHTFYPDDDWDWMTFPASAGHVYTSTTFNLLLDTDTVLRLYDTDGSTLLAINDDYPGAPEPFASQIVWTAPADGDYYLMVKDFYNRGLCLGYDINLITAVPASGGPHHVYVPWVEHMPISTPTPSPTWTPTATPSSTASPTPTATDTPTPTPTSTPVPQITPIAVPGIDTPNALAVNPDAGRLYVTSRDNDRLFVLDGDDYSVLAQVDTGDAPYGVAANPVTGKVYVAGFGDGILTVVDGATNQPIKQLLLGGELTYVALNSLTNRVYVVSHAINGLYVLDGETDTVLRLVSTGDPGLGPFGLAVNEALDRVYVSNRDSQQIATLDGDGNLLPGQVISPEPPGAVPFALAFNPNDDKLYAMLAPRDRVNRVQIYRADSAGLTLLDTVRVDNGGPEGGGGIAVNPATGHVFATNTATGTLAVIDGASNTLLAQVAVGDDPFGVAVDPLAGLVFVANRGSNNLVAVVDGF